MERGSDKHDPRGELARHLQGASFPAGRDDLVADARQLHAPVRIIATLEELPTGPVFRNVGEVWEALRAQGSST